MLATPLQEKNNAQPEVQMNSNKEQADNKEEGKDQPLSENNKVSDSSDSDSASTKSIDDQSDNSSEKSIKEELSPISQEQNFPSEIMQTAIESHVNIENEKKPQETKTEIPKTITELLTSPKLNEQKNSKDSDLPFFKTKNTNTLNKKAELLVKEKEQLLERLKQVEKELQETNKRRQEIHQKNLEGFNKNYKQFKPNYEGKKISESNRKEIFQDIYDQTKALKEKEKKAKEARSILTEDEKNEIEIKTSI